ncbi:hypothetical protein [Micrococcus terreus]|uniref:Uncharacterized protein n=1 Tax=Micrococcus terreus TaxID=574650 RepID=A0A1I7MRV1_9MICC|nr:hypothetical protein [Micrococcus terreus]SFV24631.1 hypothetical protein SAMN04487966_11224 [Micrococcus terreus]
MEYLVPLLIMAAVALIVVVLVRWLGRGSTSARPAGEPRSQEHQAPRGGIEAARAAAGRLDQQTHREVYRLIAQGKPAEAIAAYRRHTDRGPLESVWDVQALAAHPQPWQAPGAEEPGQVQADEQAPGRPDDVPHPSASPAVGAPSAGSDDAVEAPTLNVPADLTDLRVPDEWAEQGPAVDPEFELEVVREDTTVRVSSADLPPWLRDQLTAMVRDGQLEPAAEELANHSVLTTDEALQFLQIMGRDRRGELGG